MGALTDEQPGVGKTSEAQAFASGRSRLDAIDLLRGVVMVVMALDHVRDYFNNTLFTDPPTDATNLHTTNAALFLTRWVTHFCAPTFVFLAGTGAFLAGSRGKTRKQLSWFLLSRGLWLVLLEITLVRLGWSFNFHYGREFGGGVIWAIGWSMVLLSGLVFLPTSAVTVFGVALVAFHNLMDGKTAPQVGLPGWLWVILHSPGDFRLLDTMPLKLQEMLMEVWPRLTDFRFGTGYSLLPWLGVMSAGYGFGSLFLLDRAERRRQLFGLGIALSLVFVALRYSNAYGDPSAWRDGDAGPWSVQGNFAFTLFSFVNCHKYPPLLLFLLMTLGPAITALALFDRDCGRVGRFFVTFGRVPLFYYLFHIPLIHGLVVGTDYLRYGWSPYLSDAPWTIDRKHVPPNYGYDLPVVYLVWLSVVLLLYPLCWWFAGVKRRRKDAWLSYL
jgi:uncharacterized membrane protein